MMMTEEIRQGTITGFGERLKNARESLHLSEKDAAARLHLNPNIIQILENESFQDAPPPTFLRGYIKSYARLLDVSEPEINEALEKLGLSIQPSTVAISPPLSTDNLDRNEKYVQWITYLVIAVLLVMVGIWCNSHYSSLQNTLSHHILTQQTVSQPTANKIQSNQMLAASSAQPAITTPQQNNEATNPIPAAGPQAATNQPNNSQTTKLPNETPNSTQATAAPATPAQGPQQAATSASPAANNSAPAITQSPTNANNSTPTNQAGNNKLAKHPSSPADVDEFDNSNDDGDDNDDNGMSIAVPEPGLEPN